MSMGAIIVLTPVVIASWPAIAAAVAGAASAVGLMVGGAVKDSVRDAVRQEEKAEQKVEMELADSEVLAKGLTNEKEIVLTKGDVELRVSRDERGRCKVSAKSKTMGHSHAELKQITEQFVQKMTQCFIYNRVASELKTKGFQMVNEEVMKDDTIRIHVRRWEE
jgi:hypothetical protein